MPRPRFQRLSEPERRHLLAVAARHFAADGFAHASLNQILADAGISKGAAYYYFDDKGDLFATVIEHAWEEMRAELWRDGDFEALIERPADRFWADLEALYRRQLRLFQTHPDVWRMAKALPDTSDPSAARLQPRIDALMATILRFFTRAQERGLVRTDLPLDLLFGMMSALDGAIDRWVIDHPGVLDTDPELPGRTFAALRALVVPPERA